MRLKKLTLHGFKSFAEKIELNFDSDLIAIVGPNGCGKSNIVDAILWVLGEQSAKSLRAEKMQDVLFSGADSLKPVNIAEVSLHFSDVESPFGDEIVISRRVYRDGETQYLINKKEVRLKDVQDLFLGSGIGKNGLFVFEQGRIDEIINMSPEKRRVIFEETAGISKFLQKKKESASKLVEVDQNFYRLKDLHVEIEKQYRNLERQASKAKTYKETKDLLENLEKQILAFKIQEQRQALSELEKNHIENEQKLKDAEQNNSHLEKSLFALRQEYEAFENKKNEVQQNYFQAKTSIKLLEVELKSVTEANGHLESREKRILSEKEKLHSSTTEKDQEKEEKEKEFELLDEEKKGIEKTKKIKEVALDEFEKKIAAYFNEEKRDQKLFLDEVQKEGILANKVQEKELKIETFIVSEQALNQKIKEKKEQIKTLQIKIEEKKNEVSSLLETIEKEKEELHRCQKKGEAVLLKSQEKLEQKDALVLELMEATHKERALLQLQEEGAGFSNGAKELLKGAKDKTSPIFGKVQELYHSLNSTQSLNLYEETLVIKKEDVETIIHFALEKKLGNFSLILSEDLPLFKETFLASNRIQNLEAALTMYKKKKGEELFTDFGLHINRYGVFFYQSQEKSLFSRLNEIKQLKKLKEEREGKKQTVEDELVVLLNEKKDWEQTRLILEQKRQKKEMTLLQENFFLQRLMEDLKEAEINCDKLEKERQNHQHALEKLKEEIKETLENLKSSRKLKESIKKNLENLEVTIKQMRGELTKKITEVTEIRKDLEKVVTKLQGVKEKIKVFEIQSDEDKKEKARIVKELSEIETLKANYQEKTKKLLDEKEQMQKQKEELEASVLQFDGIKHEAQEKKKGVEGNLIQSRKQLKDLEKEGHKIELRLAEKKTALQSLLETCQFEIQEVIIENNFLLAEAEKKAYDFRFEIESMNVISLSAIEECAEQEKRFFELDMQLKDISEAKADLEKIIAKLEKESRSLLKETFEHVRSCFQKNFKILFNGGEADLSFTNSDNLLDSGVEILAKPPGKKMRTLSLLSGGEKCLTTLALLFALFEVKPAPFCILDEVDAPLDEVNVGRFTSLLKQFVSKTQFLIVTHNKKTMAVADSLVGISMEQRGISKLVYLNLSNKESMQGAAS